MHQSTYWRTRRSTTKKKCSFVDTCSKCFLQGMIKWDSWTKGQAYMKWGNTNEEVRLFLALFNDLKIHWQSGESDASILNKVLKMFRLEHVKGFKHIEVWKVIKYFPKCRLLRTAKAHIDGFKKLETSHSDYTTLWDDCIEIDLKIMTQWRFHYLHTNGKGQNQTKWQR